jgi:hypothetical protein
VGACIAPPPQRVQAKEHRTTPVALTEPQRSAKSVFVAMQQRYTLANSLDDQGTVKSSLRALKGATWETRLQLSFHAAFERTTKRFALDIAGPMVGVDDDKRTVMQTRMQVWGSAPGVVHVWSSGQPPVDPRVGPPEGANPSRLALHVAAYDCRTWGFGLGFALNGAAGRCAYDASVYDGISFWARSGGLDVTARLTVGTRQTQPFAYGGDGSCEAAGNRGCWDQYSVPIALTPDWRQYALSWADLRFPSSGKAVPFDIKQLTSIALSTTAEPTIVREIWLDQVSFFKGKPAASPF